MKHMFDIRKIVVVLLIAILFSVFVFSTISAVYPQPQWDEYCTEFGPRLVAPDKECAVIDVPEDERTTCEDERGQISYRYDSNGCAESYYCETCQNDYQAAQDRHDQTKFYISALLALIVIFVALNLPAKKKKNNVHEWIGTGLLLGGAFVLLFGTVQGFNSLDRFVKPVVMLLELVLVIYLAYKKFN